jgi:hypothetical protein
MSTTSAASEHFRYFMGIAIICFNMTYQVSILWQSCCKSTCLAYISLLTLGRVPFLSCYAVPSSTWLGLLFVIYHGGKVSRSFSSRTRNGRKIIQNGSYYSYRRTTGLFLLDKRLKKASVFLLLFHLKSSVTVLEKFRIFLSYSTGHTKGELE